MSIGRLRPPRQPAAGASAAARSPWVHTMLRCVTVAATALGFALPVGAQMPRSFPADALRGEMVFVQPPHVTIEGRPALLGAGVRVHGEDNRIVPATHLTGVKALVHYRLEHHGHVRQVWVLQPIEAARRPWPTTLDEARSWTFDAAEQTWTKP